MDLIRPRKVTVDEIVPGRVAKIAFEPLERGYGTTMGNSLRRVMLSSLPGAAITSVRFDGVMHEFDTIKGVREDVIDIILSLKELDMKMFSDKPQTISLDIDGAAIVTAGHLECPADVQVLNPEMVLLHMNEDSALHMEATVENGRGYVPAQEREGHDHPIGTLFVDASFSPVRRVATRIEAARVGQRTDYDKLIMEVETDGSLTPEESIGMAAGIMKNQLVVFTDFSATEAASLPADTGADLADLLRRPIDHLDLSVRSMNCLKSDNVFYVGDLVIRSEQQMLRTPNFGRKSLTEIKEVLSKMGLELGMQVEDWPPLELAAPLEPTAEAQKA